ncbi:MAG: hypothetical protein H7287_04840 [Thermoleophilia bacterium]|nr:hypothetical protein [Thermoleophilia bacterium]
MRRRRILQAVLSVVVLAALVGWFTHRAQLHAAWQVATIAASLEDVPVGSRLTRVLTREPGAASTVTVAGLPATRVRAGGGGAAPALVLLVPGDTTAADLADIGRAQRAIARAGFTAWAVRVGRAGAGSTSLEDDVPLVAALAAIAADESTAGRSISVAAGGADASRALVAPADPKLRRDVRAVLAVQPVADVQGLVRLAVTGQTRTADGRDVRHGSAAKVRGDAGRSIVQLVRDRSGGVDAAAAGALDEVLAADDPIAAFTQLPTDYLDADLRAIQAVLGAPDPQSFDAAWQRLPADLRASADALSPSTAAGQVRARVLIVEPERDGDYPAADGMRLAEALPAARVRASNVISAAAARAPSRGQVQALLADATWWIDAAND